MLPPLSQAGGGEWPLLFREGSELGSSTPRVAPHLLCPRTWTTFPFPVSPPLPHPLPSKLRARGRGGALEAFGTRLSPVVVTSFLPGPGSRLPSALLLWGGFCLRDAVRALRGRSLRGRGACSTCSFLQRPRAGTEPAALLPDRPPRGRCPPACDRHLGVQASGARGPPTLLPVVCRGLRAPSTCDTGCWEVLA